MGYYLAQLNRINTKIKEADLSTLVIKDEYNGVVITKITEELRKKIISDNKYLFNKDKKIRYQIFTKSTRKR